ncbi:hypothetical protein [Nonomuraea recticatena]|uniref:hypothetical protein n=1 Tax=Nonomuraea recticatena TaxID=46178 RepID=UPI0036178A14
MGAVGVSGASWAVVVRVLVVRTLVAGGPGQQVLQQLLVQPRRVEGVAPAPVRERQPGRHPHVLRGHHR